MIGSEKKYTEKNRLKKIAYALFGEVAVPGRLRMNHVIKRLKQLPMNGGGDIRVLDAGSGRGDLAIYLSKKFPQWNILGVELDTDRLAIAQYIKNKLNAGNLDFVQGDLLRLGYDGMFDVVVCSDVLEHIENDGEVLKNLHAALRPGGMLVLTFPSMPQRRHLKLVKWREKKIGFTNADYGHVRDGYSVEGITGVLARLGFNEISCTATFGFWGTLSFDLFFIIGDNKPNPLVFLIAFPVLLATALLDLYVPSKQGSALLVTAKK